MTYPKPEFLESSFPLTNLFNQLEIASTVKAPLSGYGTTFISLLLIDKAGTLRNILQNENVLVMSNS